MAVTLFDPCPSSIYVSLFRTHTQVHLLDRYDFFHDVALARYFDIFLHLPLHVCASNMQHYLIGSLCVLARYVLNDPIEASSSSLCFCLPLIPFFEIKLSKSSFKW